MFAKPIAKHDLPIINLDGEDGNVFYLMATAKRFATQLGYSDPKQVALEMSKVPYLDALEVFETHFGHLVRFETKNEAILDFFGALE